MSHGMPPAAAAVPMPVTPAGAGLGLDLASAYRQLYRAEFRARLAAGDADPFLVPLGLLALWVLPTLYLAVPHRRRPWLYHARWLLLAVCLSLNARFLARASSLNFASAYAAGLLAAWGTIWNLTLLVWTRPQWEARRVEVRKRLGSGRAAAVDGRPGDGVATGVTGSASLASAAASDEAHPHLATNGHPVGNNLQSAGEPRERVKQQIGLRLRKTPRTHGVSPADEAKPCDDGHEDDNVEYYWQEYPEDAHLLTRMGWAFDLASTMRLTGWNWAIPCLPPYELPPSLAGPPPRQAPLSSLPDCSRQGFTRTCSRREMVTSRLLYSILPTYIIVDLCAVLMTEDPYFLAGPEHGQPLPAHLASLPSSLLSLRRTMLSFGGILSALRLVFDFGAVALVLFGPPVLGFRAHPWHLPTMSGSFVSGVLDRGLAGFWGTFWHQTFRFGFAAPAIWLQRRGLVGRADRWWSPSYAAAASVSAFVQSGMLHAAGSYSTIPPTHWWKPPLFFLTSASGVMVQRQLVASLDKALAAVLPVDDKSNAKGAGGEERAGQGKGLVELPRWARRAGNLVFVFCWLHATAWLLLDDFGRCGLWLFEPVPVSVFRALPPIPWAGGSFVLGDPADRRVWRYDRDFAPRWHAGAAWWDRGLAV